MQIQSNCMQFSINSRQFAKSAQITFGFAEGNLLPFGPQNYDHRVGRVLSVSFLHSLELGPTLWSGGGGHTRLRLKWWGSPNSNEGTYTVVLYIYKYFVIMTVNVWVQDFGWWWGGMAHLVIILSKIFLLQMSRSKSTRMYNKIDRHLACCSNVLQKLKKQVNFITTHCHF
jgi:hypothetical protein